MISCCRIKGITGQFANALRATGRRSRVSISFRDYDLLLNFHPAAVRASTNFALRPNFGSPEGRFFRLSHDGGLDAPA
jgi:hypothetical protein